MSSRPRRRKRLWWLVAGAVVAAPPGRCRRRRRRCDPARATSPTRTSRSRTRRRASRPPRIRAEPRRRAGAPPVRRRLRLAALRLHEGAHPLPAGAPRAAPAVPRGVAVDGPRPARVPARPLRPAAVPAQEQRRALRDQPRWTAACAGSASSGALAAASPACDGRHRLRDAARALPRHEGGRVAAVDARRPHALVAQAAQPRRSPRRCSTAAGCTSAPRTARSTRCARATAPCAGRTKAGGAVKGALALDGRQALLRRLRRPGPRDPPAPTAARSVDDGHRAAARSASAVGQLLLDARGRLRPRLHRQHGRRRVLVLGPRTASSPGARRPAATSTPRPPSARCPAGARRSTSAPTTGSSTRSTPARAACAGARHAGREDLRRRRRSSATSSSSPTSRRRRRRGPRRRRRRGRHGLDRPAAARFNPGDLRRRAPRSYFNGYSSLLRSRCRAGHGRVPQERGRGGPREGESLSASGQRCAQRR